MNKNILSPSLLAADFSRLNEELAVLKENGAQWLHLDVMDGLFVPSISFGLPVIKSLRAVSDLTFDVHLMIQDPDRYLEDFAAAGADIITVHQEACTHLNRTLQKIHSLGLKAGVALNPATPLNTVEWVAEDLDMLLIMSVNPGFGGQKYIPNATRKIAEARRMLQELGSKADIEVDGGVNHENAASILQAGANVLVAGSAVFRGDRAKNIKRFAEILK